MQIPSVETASCVLPCHKPARVDGAKGLAHALIRAYTDARLTGVAEASSPVICVESRESTIAAVTRSFEPALLRADPLVVDQAHAVDVSVAHSERA